jgi:hypothetical protein
VSSVLQGTVDPFSTYSKGGPARVEWIATKRSMLSSCADTGDRSINGLGWFAIVISSNKGCPKSNLSHNSFAPYRSERSTHGISGKILSNRRCNVDHRQFQFVPRLKQVLQRVGSEDFMGWNGTQHRERFTRLTREKTLKKDHPRKRPFIITRYKRPVAFCAAHFEHEHAPIF